MKLLLSTAFLFIGSLLICKGQTNYYIGFAENTGTAIRPNDTSPFTYKVKIRLKDASGKAIVKNDTVFKKFSISIDGAENEFVITDIPTAIAIDDVNVIAIQINALKNFDINDGIEKTLKLKIEGKEASLKTNDTNISTTHTITINPSDKDAVAAYTQVAKVVNAKEKDTTEVVGTLRFVAPKVKEVYKVTSIKLYKKNIQENSKANDNNHSDLQDLRNSIKQGLYSRSEIDTYIKNHPFANADAANLDSTTTEKDSKKGGKSDTKDTHHKVTINNVQVQFQEGIATEIKVVTNDGIFSNIWEKDCSSLGQKSRVGISFRHMIYTNRYVNYWLVNDEEKDKFSIIRLYDVLRYDPAIGQNYVPKDTIIVLSPKNPQQDLKITTSLKSFINLSIYSDLLSVLNPENGNGLLQSEASATIYCNTLPNNHNFLGLKGINVWGNYIQPFLKFSRFENGFGSVVPEITYKDSLNTQGKTVQDNHGNNLKSKIKDPNSTYLNRMFVNQRKYFDIGLKFNMLKVYNKFHSRLEWNIYADCGWFNIQGDTIKNNTTSNVPRFQQITSNTLEFGMEFKGVIFQSNNFGVTLATTVYTQNVWNNKNKIVSDAGFRWFFMPEFEMFYFPIANKNNKIFLRSRWVLNNSSFVQESNYVQLQFGYKIAFSLPSSKI